jgi:protein gp37
VTGCTWANAGCDNCYAKALNDTRFIKNTKSPRYGHRFEEILTHANRLTEPCRWKQPEIVFVNSQSDLFHADIALAFRDQIFDVMEKANHHIYLCLTKRAGDMKRYVNNRYPTGAPAHIWFGVTIVQDTTVERNSLTALRATTAAVRFVSAEPLIGSIADMDFTGIDWIIAGGESAYPKTQQVRAMDPEWARDIRDLCKAKNIAFFFKQWGHWAPTGDDRPTKLDNYPSCSMRETGTLLYAFGKTAAGHLLDGQEHFDWPTEVSAYRTARVERDAKKAAKKSQDKDPKRPADRAIEAGGSTKPITLDQVKRERMSYVWKPFIAKKTLTLLTGERSAGKTRIALDICAKVTSGEAMPGFARGTKWSNVLFFANDGMLSAKIKDWAEQSGVRSKRFHLSTASFTFKDVSSIQEQIHSTKAELVVFDSLDAFLSNRANPRPELSGLHKLVQEENVAVLIIAHPPKNGHSSVKGPGSIQDVARSILVAAKKPYSSSIGAMFHERCSYDATGTAWTYRISDDGLEWTGDNPDLTIEAFRKGNVQNKVDQARELWTSLLYQGERASADIFAAGEEACISRKTMERARDYLADEGFIESFQRDRKWWYRTVPREVKSTAA